MNPKKNEVFEIFEIGEQERKDFRQNHPFFIHAKRQNKTMIAYDLEIYSLKNTRVEFLAPNIVTMLLNIGDKAYRRASKTFSYSVGPLLKKECAKFEWEDLVELYDYLEDMKIAVIFAYNAIEAFVNNAIPESFTYKEKSSKGIVEVWDKQAILKWMSTSDKLTKILPWVRSIWNPSKENFWSDFKNLERIRNDIIHPKQLGEDLNVKNEIHKDFFHKDIFRFLSSTRAVLQFLCWGEFSERYFPIGFGSIKMKATIEIDDFQEYFEAAED